MLKALHIADLKDLMNQLTEASEFAGIIADVENDEEYFAITCLIDDIEQFNDTIDVLLQNEYAGVSTGV